MLKILIADDHHGVRAAVRDILLDEFEGVELDEAEDASMLIRMASQGEWDIIVSDLVMPHGGGLAALKHLQGNRPELPVIIFSTYPAEQYASRVLDAGAIAFVGKDQLATDLADRIREALPHHFPG